MPIRSTPPLNGRSLAEFYLSSETAKRRKALRAYARPPEEQQARILLYDPVRRAVPDYFADRRSEAVLERCTQTLERKQFDNPIFDAKYHKSNRTAIAHLRDLSLDGTFENVQSRRLSVRIGKINVLSTVDFYAHYTPTIQAAKPRDVAVVVYPSGIKKPRPEQRELWATIESEVAFSRGACKRSRRRRAPVR